MQAVPASLRGLGGLQVHCQQQGAGRGVAELQPRVATTTRGSSARWQTALACSLLPVLGRRLLRSRRRARASASPEDGLLGRRLCLCTPAAFLLGSWSGNSRAAEGGEDEVVNVIDGDTVKLAKFGRCRLIGVNTPETVSPKQKSGAPPDCYGPEASALTKQLLPPGTKVRVELDVGPTDRYGRELIYLYRAQDGMFVNAQLVQQGFARHMKVAPNVRFDDLFVKLEKEAATSGRGLWKACPVGGGSSASAPAATSVDDGPGDTKNCKDFATYEEAKAWFDKWFPLYGDVAKLDGDKDGKPCEKLLKKEKKAA